MLGLAAVADNFVYAILSEKWIGIVPYLRLFCVVLMFDMINIGNCETIKAMGRSDVFLIMEIIKKTSYLMTTIIFLKYTDSPLELAFASLINTVIAITVNSIPNIKLIDYKLSMQLYDIVPNLLASAAMCSFVLVIGRTLSNSFITEFREEVVRYLDRAFAESSDYRKVILDIYNEFRRICKDAEIIILCVFVFGYYC